MSTRKALLSIICILAFAGVLFAQECTSIISDALKRWEDIKDYSCQLYTYNRAGKEEDERVYEYKFMKPNYVYMKVLKGKSKGAKVFYDPNKNKVKGCKKVLFTVCRTFDPSAKKVTSIRGVKVYETSFGYILNTAKAYLEKGKPCRVYKEGDYTVVELETDTPIFQDIVKEKLFFDSTGFPVKWERYAKDGLVYKLVCTNVKINSGLTLEDFKP